MKYRLLLLATLLTAASTAYAGNVDVGVTISGEIQPGVYGKIELGNKPKPAVVYEQPVIIIKERTRRPPIYLNVPPGHARHWSKHCGEYNACDRQVYFVKTSEYGLENDRRRDRDERGDDRDHGGDHERGRGHGHGHGYH